MPKYSNRDHYIDAATGVLKNRLGLGSEAELEKAEVSFASIRSYQLRQTPLPGDFDLTHLKAIHRYLFQDVYDWAGEIRSVDISRGDTTFAHHRHIEAAAELIFRRLAKEKHLSGLGIEAFSERAGHYLGEINAVHPFREGNGRAQRQFISHLAYHCGFILDWEHLGRPEMIRASIESFNGDCSRFVSYIGSHLEVRERPE
ncbi:MAG TPA: Fic family protein [Pirellulales bacterium]|nr:Fic family protein [Pirellulales bacterium]